MLSGNEVSDLYLDSFSLPIEEEYFLLDQQRRVRGFIDNSYPCGIFLRKHLYDLNFRRVTILYGGNGSGKTTVLNLIAEKLGLIRLSPFNSGEMFSAYASACSVSMGFDDDGNRLRIPNGSRIITSDDVFEYMLTARANNQDISEKTDETLAERARLKYGETIKFTGLQDYEELRLQLLARKKSLTGRGFAHQTAGKETKLNSNGETAFNYFNEMLLPDRFYCLDEPENSLSPKLQMEMAKMIEELARYCGCQFVIATHSPFLLAINGARAYDLDCDPVEIRNWWELENTRTYYSFFKSHQALFEGQENQ